MPVGTDAILLGGWVNLASVEAPKILEIGTGCGIISLILASRLHAQKKTFQIEAIDIDHKSICEARDNFIKSAWSNSIFTNQIDFRCYKDSAKFDLIISNPPFFNSGPTSEHNNRANARHQSANSITWKELLYGAKQLLSPQGKIAVILPQSFEDDINRSIMEYGLHIYRIATLQSKESVLPKRILIEVGLKLPTEKPVKEVIIQYQTDGKWHSTYRTHTHFIHHPDYSEKFL